MSTDSQNVQGDPQFPYWGRYWAGNGLDGEPADLATTLATRQQLYLVLAAIADIETELSLLLRDHLDGGVVLEKLIDSLGIARLRQWSHALDLISDEVSNDINLLAKVRNHLAHGSERLMSDTKVEDTLLTLATTAGDGLTINGRVVKMMVDGDWRPLTAKRLIDTSGTWGAFLMTAQRVLQQLYFSRTGQQPGILPPDGSG
ncbi:hypothetical protein [Rubrivirga sp. IMCC43871]|uniref:hypothetical protein n=1 Tax=Rubrivirga sp. IMCC43871 TaxID=3391575 RepID=UPI00398FCC99